MVTIAEWMARRGGPVVAAVRVEGWGDGDGQYTFCSGVPTYASGDDNWISILTDLPKTLSTRIDPTGGVLEAGSFPFGLLDRDDFLTGFLRFESDAETMIASSQVNPGDTQFFVQDASNLSVDQVIWVGAEAMRIDQINSLTLTVTRGFLGTEAYTHFAYDPVRTYPPRPEGRTVELYLIPADADGSSEELLIDQFQIERLSWSPDWTTWQFTCSSRVLQTKRTVGAAANGYFEVSFMGGSGQTLLVFPVGRSRDDLATVWPSNNGRRYFQLEKKEVFIGRTAGNFMIHIEERGKIGTRPEIEFGINLESYESSGNGARITLGLFAETADGIGDFRWSPSNSQDRAIDFVQSDHWVDIMLCLMTSSRRDTDGIELVNGDATYGNWSSLPLGWGAGILASRINFETFVQVKERTPDWRFPAFSLTSPKKLGKLLQEQFLKPLGAFLTIRNGLIDLVLPRLPLEGEGAPALDHSQILREPRSRGAASAMISGAHNYRTQIKAVLLKTRAPDGTEQETLISVSDLEGQLGQREPITGRDDILELQVPGARVNQAGVQLFLEELAIRKIFRHQKPPINLDVGAMLSVYDRAPGDLQQLTFSGAPNLRDGTRGWTDVLVTITEMALRLDLKAPGPRFDLVVMGYGPSVSVGRVAPAAYVDSWDPVQFDATVEANRYTDPDNATVLGLPADDADAFAVDARCKVISEGGQLQSPSSGGQPAGEYQTITQINSNVIRFNGDWGGLDPTGMIIILEDYDNARTEQRDRFVAAADRAARTVGSSTRRPWGYGEQ